MKKVMLASLIMLILVRSTLAQEPSLWLGGMEMRIGMRQTTVMDSLSKYYDLRQFTRPGSYLIYERKRNEDVEPKTIGQVAFDNGKLIYAVKEWYDAEVGSAMKLVDVLHAVLAQLEQRGERVATIETRTVREPKINMLEVKLVFGKRWITISTHDFKGARNVKVDETIRFAPFPK
jgi:hypothetical protein